MPAPFTQNVIYEVTLLVDDDPSLLEAVARWLEAHVGELLAIDGFLSATVEHPTGAHARAPGGRRVIVCRYTLRDRAALEAYYTQHAARMRAGGQARFGGRWSATRRELVVQHAAASPASGREGVSP